MIKTDRSSTDANLIMKAVVISDVEFAAKACATLRRVERESAINVCWRVKCWQADAMKEAAFAEKALDETLDAHLLVLQACHARSLPLWLEDWIERWAALRKIEDAALGVINDASATVRINGVSPELSSLIGQHGLKLIMDECASAKNELQLPVHFSHEREVSLPLERPRFVTSTAP